MAARETVTSRLKIWSKRVDSPFLPAEQSTWWIIKSCAIKIQVSELIKIQVLYLNENKTDKNRFRLQKTKLWPYETYPLYGIQFHNHTHHILLYIIL